MNSGWFYHYHHLLCCPACKGELQEQSDIELYCRLCNLSFPIISGIPLLFPFNVQDRMEQLFGRYWDSEEKANLYDRFVEGDGDIFGTYNHKAEVYGLTHCYDPAKLHIVLDAGCGNGRFFETFPAPTIKIGLDSSLNLLRIVKQKKIAHLLVCGELEHLPFRDHCFDTVISCRVLQHLHEQQRAVTEIARVTRPDGDVILELYNVWNPKTIYKNIRMSPSLRRVFNAPFRLLFRSLSPFDEWGLTYDRYNGWFQVKDWMQGAGLRNFRGRGVGFGYHKYLLEAFYVNAVLGKKTPRLLASYYDACFAVERGIGALPPFRYLMEKFVLKGTKSARETKPSLVNRLRRKLLYVYKGSDFYNRAALRERNRETVKIDVLVRENDFHLHEAIAWLKRAQDATPDRGVARGYSVGWTAYLDVRGWQPSYPETTGYIIPTFFDCAEHFANSDLRNRAVQMADWEIAIQMANGAVMGGTVDQTQTPAVFNTGQVLLGWLRAYDETQDKRYFDASQRAARFLVDVQAQDGAWRDGNSLFANPHYTTYNSRVGWALILFGERTHDRVYGDAGLKAVEYTLSQQTQNGWFRNNCLSDPSAPLLHTICYAIEGLLGAYHLTDNTKYLEKAILPVDHLVGRLRNDGSIQGRLDSNWNGTTQWSCLTGCAQLAAILLEVFSITGNSKYQTEARKILVFLKSTQNCVAPDGGLRGGIKGSYPFDGNYGRHEVLSWATKFYIDALLLDEKLS